jgi:general secretion pathway protein K
MAANFSQRGVALAIVVWFLAAMSLLVSGIVFQAKVDTRMAQLHAAKAKAVAAGDGAIQLMLANMQSGKPDGFDRAHRLPTMEFEIGDYPVTVHLVPVAGLIDLNGAAADILALLFIAQGGLDDADAQFLAGNVVKWRTVAGRKQAGTGRFAAIEDLLRVDGVTRTLLDGIRDSVAVSRKTQGAVDWSLAPASVLEVLALKNPGRASSMLNEFQKRSGAGNKNNRLGSAAGASAGAYRLDAIVSVGDQQWLRRRWASAGKTAGGLPWRYVRTEAPRVFLGSASGES